MGMECQVCHKKPIKGRKYVRSGKAKYLGGVGRKVRGITTRTFKPNLQSIRCEVNGSVKRMRVCVACIRSGRVKRPVVNTPFSLQNV